MIGRILYRESCQGVLKYVFGKEGMRILGYGNMYSQDISQKFFTSVLHFQGQRNATKNRYVHISLNLPHGEHLDDDTFHEVSKEYMEQMGYGDQPYVVLRHNDTRHEHVHIVTTNVKDNGKVMGIFNSYRRNLATQRYLEKKFGLSPSPGTKQHRELPIHRLPGLQFEMDPDQGAKFYLQDVLNSILQKHKVRSFGELARLIAPYHFELRQIKSKTGRIGVSYGLNNQKGYRTRFINGSTVHPQLSGPKLQKVFDINAKSKLLPMHRKRLEKQIWTTYGLFRAIRSNDLAQVLKEYQDIDMKLDVEGDAPMGYTIFDKSGYVFTDREIGPNIQLKQRPDIFGNGDGPTEIDIHGGQLVLEIRKLIQEALYSSHSGSTKQHGLFSERISVMHLKDIIPTMRTLEGYHFLKTYLPKDQQGILERILQQEFPSVREKLCGSEFRKEKEIFDGKVELIKNILDNNIFDLSKEKVAIHHLFRSLGLEYGNNRLTVTGSDRFVFQVALGHIPLPRTMAGYVPPGLVRQNYRILGQLMDKGSGKDMKLGPSAFFLPMVFPKLYGTMEGTYRQKFEGMALRAYIKYAERMHAPFEKSPMDYIGLFNAKGFYLDKTGKGLEIKSIYTNGNMGFPLPKKTCAYLQSVPDLDTALKDQHIVIRDIIDKDRDDLRNLWTGHLMERGLYDRVAHILIGGGAYPNLRPEVMRAHMDNGLRKSIVAASERKSSTQQDRFLRKSVYAMNSLLDNKSKGGREAFNGFKDELTDRSKYKGRGLWI